MIEALGKEGILFALAIICFMFVRIVYWIGYWFGRQKKDW